MKYSLNQALVGVSVALAAVSMRLWVRRPRFFDFCISLQSEAMPRLLMWSFVGLLCAAAFQFSLIWAGGPLTVPESERVFAKLKSVSITLIFEFAVVNFQGFGSLLFFGIVLLGVYIAGYFNQKVVAFSTSANLPSPRQHQCLFFGQITAFVAMVYMMALSSRYLPLAALFHVIGALITSALSILLDMIRHITFLYDHEELGASVDVYRVTFVAECAVSVLDSAVSLCFLLCMLFRHHFSYYYLRSFYDSALKLPVTLKKWRTWVRLRRMIEQLPPCDERDLAREDMCIVCRVQMQLGDGRRLPCGHCFHPECIERWVGQQTQCPICKCDLTAALAEAERKLAEAEAEVRETEAQPDDAEPQAYKFEDLMSD
jgi:hypothetical protein